MFILTYSIWKSWCCISDAETSLNRQGKHVFSAKVNALIRPIYQERLRGTESHCSVGVTAGTVRTTSNASANFRQIRGIRVHLMGQFAIDQLWPVKRKSEAGWNGTGSIVRCRPNNEKQFVSIVTKMNTPFLGYSKELRSCYFIYVCVFTFTNNIYKLQTRVNIITKPKKKFKILLTLKFFSITVQIQNINMFIAKL